MHHTLSDTLTRRWLIVVAVLAGLAALSVSLIPSTSAQQGLPEIPHWFWGTDAHAFVGANVYALDQNGNRLASTAGEDHPMVDAQGGWAYVISTDEASRVTFQIETRDGTLGTNAYNVVGNGEDTEISIRDFSNEVSAAATKDIRVIARLHPTRALRTLEFNIRVDGVDKEPPPQRRYLGPDLPTNRWLYSSEIDAGGGFRVRVIACKQDDDDVIFGVRVVGHDDIIPQLRRLGTNITHNRWLHSSEIPIPLPGNSQTVTRLTADPGCTGGGLAP